MKFQAEWEKPFSPNDVRWETFYSSNGFVYEGDMMYMETHVHCDYMSEIDMKGILLPFKVVGVHHIFGYFNI